MKKTETVVHRFDLDPFLDKLGINGDHVVNLSRVYLVETTVPRHNGNLHKHRRVEVELQEIQE